MPIRCNSLRSVRTGAGFTPERLARAANIALRTILNEEDAVAKALPGGGCIEHGEQVRIAAALGSSVAALRA